MSQIPGDCYLNAAFNTPRLNNAFSQNVSQMRSVPMQQLGDGGPEQAPHWLRNPADEQICEKDQNVIHMISVIGVVHK